jgi:hypothetical protein
MDQISERREQLLAQLQAAAASARGGGGGALAGEPAREEALLQELERLQLAYNMHHGTYQLAIGGGAFTPVQLAVWIVSAYPWQAPPTAMEQAMRELREERERGGGGGGS